MLKDLSSYRLIDAHIKSKYCLLTNNALLLNSEKFKIYIKIHINIAATCFGLRPSSGNLYRAWLKLYFC